MSKFRIDKFSSHIVVRSRVKEYKDYKSYRKNLSEDFNQRCGYCNLNMNSVTTSFEIDHFIPKDTFKTKKPELSYDYANLVFSCKKCNLSKSSKSCGSITDNSLFYEPGSVRMNEHFQRINGMIFGLDIKAVQCVKEIGLYRPIHRLGWLVEKIDEILTEIQSTIDGTVISSEKKKLLDLLKIKLLDEYRKQEKAFISSYNISEKYDWKIL